MIVSASEYRGLIGGGKRSAYQQSSAFGNGLIRQGWIGGGKRSAYQKSFSGKSCCGGGGLGTFLEDAWEAFTNPTDLAWGLSNCPQGQIPKGWFGCQPITVRTDEGTRDWKGTQAPSPLQNAYDYYGEKVPPIADPLSNFLKNVNWMTVGLVALVGIAIVKKL